MKKPTTREVITVLLSWIVGGFLGALTFSRISRWGDNHEEER